MCQYRITPNIQEQLQSFLESFRKTEKEKEKSTGAQSTVGLHQKNKRTRCIPN